MTKTELKQNITKINKLLRSENYEAGIELIKTYNEPEINKGVPKTIITVLKQKFLRERNYDIIDNGIKLAVQFSSLVNDQDIFDFVLIDTMKTLKEKDAAKSFNGSTPRQPYYDYVIWNLIGYLTPQADIKECNIKSYHKRASWTDYILERFPEGICNISSLEILKIVGKGESDAPYREFEIPDAISNLKNLKEFSCNKLDSEELKKRVQTLLPNTQLNN